MEQIVNAPNKIIVHHTAVGSSHNQFLNVEQHHRKRGFEISTLGYHVGYHYFIEKDGTTKQARAESDKGQHTTGENLTSIGICLAGNFDHEIPTPEQTHSMVMLINRLLPSYNIPIHAIYPHRNFANKSCYGSNLADNWAKVQYIRYKLGWIMAQLEKIKDLLKSFLK